MLNNPFSYSHSKHKRQYSPRQYADYSKYKATLRLEYERKCIYCRFPDTVKGYDNFGVEHYRPKSLFPHLRTEYSNLFYCCNTCNRRKGNDFPDTVFVPNPDDHVMIDHLRFKKETVEPITEAGKYACELLQLNDPSVVRTRNALLTSLQDLEKTVAKLDKLEIKIKKAFNKGEITLVERDSQLGLMEKVRLEKLDAINVIAGRD